MRIRTTLDRIAKSPSVLNEPTGRPNGVEGLGLLWQSVVQQRFNTSTHEETKLAIRKNAKAARIGRHAMAVVARSCAAKIYINMLK